MDNSINDAADIFKALGDPTRLKIIRLLLSYSSNICVGMLAHKIGISQPAVSQHLRVLKNAGLVESNRMGFHMHYNIKNNALDNYGIDISQLLKNIKMELELNESCEYNGNEEICDDFKK